MQSLEPKTQIDDCKSLIEVATAFVFDGANIWVNDFNSTTVRELLLTSRATLHTFTVGTAPKEAAFDGAHIGVTNFGGTTVSKL